MLALGPQPHIRKEIARVKGLALHLRMHPFTWHEVKEACDMLTHKKPRALDHILVKDAATLQAAVGLVCLGGRPS